MDAQPPPIVVSITELTREFGVSTRTLRFYEEEGLLAPLRRGRTRLYRPSDRTRLKLILRGKRLGFSLSDIREIISMYDQASGELRQLGLVLDRIKQRREELERKRKDIEATLSELNDVEARCRARFEELNAGASSDG